RDEKVMLKFHFIRHGCEEGAPLLGFASRNTTARDVD
ncbi:hypothetical protein NPIL_394071, partial [Nephila pilipes]